MKFIKEHMNEALDKATPYMLRNDGRLFNVFPIHPYMKYIITDTDKKSIEDLLNRRFNYIAWFYKNTQYQSVKDNIELFLASVYQNSVVKDSDNIFVINWEQVISDCNEQLDLDIPTITRSLNEDNKLLSNIDDIYSLYEYLNDETNQEFLRVRTSSMKFGGRSGDIYFRISSTDFNWFDLIWTLVYENRDWIESVTVSTDTQARGGVVKFYQHNNIVVNRLSTNDFITLSGRPVFEELDDTRYEISFGKSLNEIFQDIHPQHIHNCFTSLVETYIERNFTEV